MTPFQLDESANAPCTSTMVGAGELVESVLTSVISFVFDRPVPQAECRAARSVATACATAPLAACVSCSEFTITKSCTMPP